MMRMNWSTPRPCFTAAWMPSGTDTSTDSSSDTDASARVAGNASAISRGHRRSAHEAAAEVADHGMPRRKSAYCTRKGRSRPRPLRMFCRSCSVTLPAPWLSIRAGSPDRRTAYETNSVTTRTTKIACSTRLRTNPLTEWAPRWYFPTPRQSTVASTKRKRPSAGSARFFARLLRP